MFFARERVQQQNRSVKFSEMLEASFLLRFVRRNVIGQTACYYFPLVCEADGQDNAHPFV